MTPTATLAGALTPFAQELAAVGERVLAPTEVLEPFLAILKRYGLEDHEALTQPDGRRWPTWAAAPSIWIRAWATREVAFVLYEDGEGPKALEIVVRLADSVRRRRIGGA